MSIGSLAVVMEMPKQLSLRTLDLCEQTDEDVVVDVEWSGISTGTERLLWTGQMPVFPGMGYPLVPGYESVGRISKAGERSGRSIGERVFVPGSKGFQGVRGLFGGAASRLVVPGRRVVSVGEKAGAETVLFALAATAYHAVSPASGRKLPDLIVGHGVLGRLIARIVVALGGAPVVWEKDAARQTGADGYVVLHPESDADSRYQTICDASGSNEVLTQLITQLVPGGALILAGFYEEPISFDFTLAFRRELNLHVAAEWKEGDLTAVLAMVANGTLSLDSLITHTKDAAHAADAYHTAFNDAACLKMILDWRTGL